jgi:hypothetical protein
MKLTYCIAVFLLHQNYHVEVSLILTHFRTNFTDPNELKNFQELWVSLLKFDIWHFCYAGTITCKSDSLLYLDSRTNVMCESNSNVPKKLILSTVGGTKLCTCRACTEAWLGT